MSFPREGLYQPLSSLRMPSGLGVKVVNVPLGRLRSPVQRFPDFNRKYVIIRKKSALYCIQNTHHMLHTDKKDTQRLTSWFRGLLRKLFRSADYSPIRIYLKSRREQHSRLTL